MLFAVQWELLVSLYMWQMQTGSRSARHNIRRGRRRWW